MRHSDYCRQATLTRQDGDKNYTLVTWLPSGPQLQVGSKITLRHPETGDVLPEVWTVERLSAYAQRYDVIQARAHDMRRMRRASDV